MININLTICKEVYHLKLLFSARSIRFGFFNKVKREIEGLLTKEVQIGVFLQILAEQNLIILDLIAYQEDKVGLNDLKIICQGLLAILGRENDLKVVNSPISLKDFLSQLPDKGKNP